MIKQVSYYDFRDAFLSSDNYKNKYSIDGLIALFDYLEEFEDSTGEQLQFDMVCIACDYTEYASAIEAMSNYDDTLGISEQDALEWLEERTDVIKFDKGVIIRNF